jgi:hypothetical protein
VVVILEHYSKVLDEPEDAVRFREITPDNGAENVVAFSGAVA